MARRKQNKAELIKYLVATGIMVISTSLIIFNNVGQSLQLFQLNLSRNLIYWIAGISFGIGALWVSYLNRLLKI